MIRNISDMTEEELEAYAMDIRERLAKAEVYHMELKCSKLSAARLLDELKKSLDKATNHLQTAEGLLSLIKVMK